MRIVTEMVWHEKLAGDDLLVELFGGLVLEGKVAAEHHIEYDAHRPHISHETVIALAVDHLGWRVTGTSTRSLQHATLLTVV